MSPPAPKDEAGGAGGASVQPAAGTPMPWLHWDYTDPSEVACSESSARFQRFINVYHSL